jgi:hypothetical protein
VLDVALPPGDYAVVVEGFGEAEGTYSVTMTCVEEPLGYVNISGTHGGCACKMAYAISDGTCEDGAQQYSGCHFPPCDGDDGGQAGDSWCLIESTDGCNPLGENWDYCTPGVAASYSALNISDSCRWAYDGLCDEPVYCAVGSDMTDCAVTATRCPYALDGFCDEAEFCDYEEPEYCSCLNGTDTDDCSGGNSCFWSYDGECDVPLYCDEGADEYDCRIGQVAEEWFFEFDGNITCGDTVSGTTVGARSHGGHASGDHVYYFQVEEPGIHNMQFSSCGSSIDTFIRVVSHDLEREFASCDDCGPCGTQATLDSGSLHAGEYAVIIEGYSTAEGVYELRMLCQAEAAALEYDGEIHCNSTRVGDTTPNNQIWRSNVGQESTEHLYNFTVAAGGVGNLEFDTCGSDFDTYVTMRSLDLEHTYAGCDDCGACDGYQAVLVSKHPAPTERPTRAVHSRRPSTRLPTIIG